MNEMMIDTVTPDVALYNLIKKYPARSDVVSISGQIPMSEFVANEALYRDAMRKNGLRSIYRGPREISYYSSGKRKGYETWTRRRNAKFVVLYMNGYDESWTRRRNAKFVVLTRMVTQNDKMKHDKYNSAIDTLYHLTEDLFGGQYEPKSRRDVELAEDLYEILNRHRTNPFPPEA